VVFPVVSFATYRTSVGAWRGVDHDAHDFIDALKDRPLDHYSRLKVRGRFEKFDNLNRQEVVRWFGQMAADYLRAEGPIPPFALVPVPSSEASVSFRGVNRPTVLAQAIIDDYGEAATLVDVLRFRAAMSPCNKHGAPRDARVLYEQLCLTGSVRGRRVVLVDDVMASGAHLRAAAAKVLIGGEAHGILLAICGGRADSRIVADPFAVRRERLEIFPKRRSLEGQVVYAFGGGGKAHSQPRKVDNVRKRAENVQTRTVGADQPS
jgi:hypothetical protein